MKISERLKDMIPSNLGEENIRRISVDYRPDFSDVEERQKLEAAEKEEIRRQKMVEKREAKESKNKATKSEEIAPEPKESEPSAIEQFETFYDDDSDLESVEIIKTARERVDDEAPVENSGDEDVSTPVESLDIDEFTVGLGEDDEEPGDNDPGSEEPVDEEQGATTEDGLISETISEPDSDDTDFDTETEANEDSQFDEDFPEEVSEVSPDESVEPVREGPSEEVVEDREVSSDSSDSPEVVLEEEVSPFGEYGSESNEPTIGEDSEEPDPEEAPEVVEDHRDSYTPQYDQFSLVSNGYNPEEVDSILSDLYTRLSAYVETHDDGFTISRELKPQEELTLENEILKEELKRIRIRFGLESDDSVAESKNLRFDRLKAFYEASELQKSDLNES